jgi:NTE family protein
MSGWPGWRPDVTAAVRRYSQRMLEREVRALEAAGIRTAVFTPSLAEQEVMGADMMSRARLDEVIQQSFIRAGAHAATPEVAALVREAAAAGAR